MQQPVFSAQPVNPSTLQTGTTNIQNAKNQTTIDNKLGIDYTQLASFIERIEKEDIPIEKDSDEKQTEQPKPNPGVVSISVHNS